MADMQMFLGTVRGGFDNSITIQAKSEFKKKSLLYRIILSLNERFVKIYTVKKIPAISPKCLFFLGEKISICLLRRKKELKMFRSSTSYYLSKQVVKIWHCLD